MTTLRNGTWFTPDEVARYFAVSKRLVYQWIESGRIGSLRVGIKALRISRAEIERLQKVEEE